MTSPVPDSTPRVFTSPSPPTGPPICHQDPTATNPSFLDNLYDEDEDEDKDKDIEFNPFEVCFLLIFSFVMLLVVFHYRFEPIYYFCRFDRSSFNVICYEHVACRHVAELTH
jgi:hypothetical protein